MSHFLRRAYEFIVLVTGFTVLGALAGLVSALIYGELLFRIFRADLGNVAGFSCIGLPAGVGFVWGVRVFLARR